MNIMYLLWLLCIHAGGETGHNEIWTFKSNLTLKGQGESSPPKKKKKKKNDNKKIK